MRRARPKGRARPLVCLAPGDWAIAASSVIDRALYDPAARTLAVTFTSGRKYLYEDVPAEVAREFQTAPSQGAYFNWRIRDQYEFRELE